MFENEEIIEIKICKHCGVKFEITNKDLEFLENISPLFNEKKYLIPSGNLCSACKEQRKTTFRNERKLYKRKCDFSGKNIISMYSPDKNLKIYEQDIFWNDSWDSLDYGIDFDFSKRFFEQYDNLYKNTPKLAIFNKNSENSPYSHLESDQKNCYMTIGGHWCEDSAYLTYGIKSKNSIDGFWVFSCEYSYELVNCYNLYNCKFCQYCNDCYDCSFSNNLKGSKNCFLCSNLVNKQYFIKNVGYSKEDYEKEIKKINFGNQTEIEKYKVELEKFKDNSIYIYSNIINSQNVNGHDIFNSKNIDNGFLIEDCEDCKNVTIAGWAKNSKDCHAFGAIEKAYEVISGGLESYKVCFANMCYECKNCLYCIECHNSENLFGCVSLKRKSYCILNKQYTKEEYNLLVPKIIEHMQSSGEWGEFFPSALSPFLYNETVANEYFPMTREEVLGEKVPVPFEGTGTKRGKIFNRSDYEAPIPKVDKIIPASKLPENISDIPDDILNWAIECEITKKPFRIIKEELEFYRKHNLPIPRRHPDQRHLDRMKLRNPRRLYDRKCDKCSKEIKTTYNPERPEIVYCETCYNKEIY